MTMSRPAFPYVNAAGKLKQDVSNHFAVVLGPLFGLQDRFGRCDGADNGSPLLATSVERFTVNGAPLCSVQIPPICQSRKRGMNPALRMFQKG